VRGVAAAVFPGFPTFLSSSGWYFSLPAFSSNYPRCHPPADSSIFVVAAIAVWHLLN